MIEAVASNNGVVVLSPPAGTDMEARVGTVITAMGPKKSVLVLPCALRISPRSHACVSSISWRTAGGGERHTFSESCCYPLQHGGPGASSFVF